MSPPALQNGAAPTQAQDQTQKGAGVRVSEAIRPEIEKGLDCWSVFSPASGYMPKDAVNMGQGFMNWSPPEYIRKAAAEAMEDVGANHYSIPKGRIRLRKALVEYLSESFNLPGKRKLDVENEVIVTAGANLAIYAALVGFCSPGDEVILLEPFFDQYIRNITFCGGKPVYVPLRPPASASSANVGASEWRLDIGELKRALSPRSRVLILNTPHNPIGKVFSEDELREIGRVCEEHDILIIADEVYDCLTFDVPHVRIASLSPSLWARTLTVGSAGKSFAATGWRVGWACGPPDLVRPALAAATRITFCSVSPLQEAIATGLELSAEKGFFENQRAEYKERRDVLCRYLDQLGLPYTIPDGSYFILVENSRIEIPDGFDMIDVVKDRPRDWHVSWFIAQTVGVVCIPPTDFYSPAHVPIGENFTRIAFCKDVATLEDAGKRLLKLSPYLRRA